MYRNQGVYGGRVYTTWNGTSCLYCSGEIDIKAAARYLNDPVAQANEDKIYGIDRFVLGEVGPSVAPINGVICRFNYV